MSGKVAGSAAGMKAIRKVGNGSYLLTPGEIGDLIDAMHTIVSKVEGPKKAAETEKILVKLFLKVYFQLQEKTLTIDQILDADKPLRAGLPFLTPSFQHVRQAFPLLRIT